MNCKAGDLAIVVVPANWQTKTLDGRIVEVIRFVPPRGPEPHWDQRPTWWCKFQRPWWQNGQGLVHECALLDSWLRPISGVPVHDEQPDEVTA
ncbi:hypothetical protein [Ralstonia pickettii]|uniref:hypothetical protein n=1 Tax=Ralstonia pickettii TaxID=329 RepID=UPI0015FC6526|nr:hypothetical protein [Ralstonia pickettii]MBB0026806.1 hypothetical protein [Ralstonia pickettii]MBB0034696.1 hypothetical protein [Ralstonia pickettii]MBB0099969.1 hypothetical protein [Ralstonia pickettii]MBB0109928.1 hypothetical protein [Ralstonia pickettii]MBB0130908.1 hypothetical protein [Ralstonia pickettii]